LTDKYINDGLSKGDTGFILEDHDGHYFEVDFCDDNGITIATFAFPKEEIELVEKDQTRSSME
jgi:hypothetical protein